MVRQEMSISFFFEYKGLKNDVLFQYKLRMFTYSVFHSQHVVNRQQEKTRIHKSNFELIELHIP